MLALLEFRSCLVNGILALDIRDAGSFVQQVDGVDWLFVLLSAFSIDNLRLFLVLLTDTTLSHKVVHSLINRLLLLRLILALFLTIILRVFLFFVTLFLVVFVFIFI